MTALQVASARARPSLRRYLAWHPEWWVYAVSAAGWFALVVMSVRMSLRMGLSMDMAGRHGWSAFTEDLGHWALMVPAMMLPVAAPRVRAVAQRSVWSRRQRSAFLFALAYVALFVAVGAVLLAVLVPLRLDRATGLLALVLLIGAGWQVSATRRRLVRRCTSLRLGVATGLAGDADCLRAGVRSGLHCLVECWPAMLAMGLTHSLFLMAGLTGVLLSERVRGPNPEQRAGRPEEAWVLGAFALVAWLLWLGG